MRIFEYRQVGQPIKLTHPIHSGAKPYRSNLIFFYLKFKIFMFLNYFNIFI